MTDDRNVLQRSTRATLHVKLTEAETFARSMEASATTRHISNLEAELAGIKASYARDLKEQKQKLRELVDAATSHREYQKVEAEQFYDLRTRKTWFVYNGEKYEERIMSNDEWEACTQRRLFGDGLQPGDLPQPDEGVKRGRAVKLEVIDTPEAPAGADDVRDVMREERSSRKKKDHTT